MFLNIYNKIEICHSSKKEKLARATLMNLLYDSI